MWMKHVNANFLIQVTDKPSLLDLLPWIDKNHVGMWMSKGTLVAITIMLQSLKSWVRKTSHISYSPGLHESRPCFVQRAAWQDSWDNAVKDTEKLADFQGHPPQSTSSDTEEAKQVRQRMTEDGWRIRLSWERKTLLKYAGCRHKKSKLGWSWN